MNISDSIKATQMSVEDSTVHVGGVCTGSGGDGGLWRAMMVEVRVRAVTKAKVD